MRIKGEMKQMQIMVKEMMRRKLIPALISIVLGIVIIIARKSAVDLLVKIIGGLIIAGGVGFIAMYFARPNPALGSLKMVLIIAAIMVVIGLLLINYAEQIVDMFPTIMGIVLILNGLSHLTMAGVEPGDRFISVAFGIVTLAFGILIVARPEFIMNALMIYIGIFFVVSGLMDLILIKRLGGI